VICRLDVIIIMLLR